MILAPDQIGAIPELRSCVLVGGAFDPLHAGHLAYLESASAFGPVCVAVATDARIQQLKGRPALLPQAQRMAILDHVDLVDYVIAQDDAGEAAAIEDIRPKFYAKGRDWADRLPEAEARACAQFDVPALFIDASDRDSSSGRLHTWRAAIDDAALVELEQAVAGQSAAVKWEPVTDYSFEARREFDETQADLILSHFRPAEVYDFGCGPGYLVKCLRAKGINALGFDKYPTGDAFFCDLARPMSEPPASLLICREVLEHLTFRELRRAVTNLCACSSRYIYLTTRYAPGPWSLLSVATKDDLDPTHISMCNQTFLRALFVLEGFKRRPDLEEAMDWMKKGRVLVYERV